MKKFLIFGLIVFSFYACNSDENDATAEQTSEEGNMSVENKDMDKYILETDNFADDNYINSLRFSNENGEYIEVKTSLDDKKQIQRILEEYSNGEGQEFGSKRFYYKNGVLVCTIKRFERHTSDDIAFVEQISYYNEKGEVTETKERVASFESDLENFPFKKVKNEGLSPDRALEVMQEKGEFVTTFQGFVEANSETYLIVGSNDGESYTSALNVPQIDASIQRLRENPKDYMGKKIKVKFTKILDPSTDYEYQELLSLNFL